MVAAAPGEARTRMQQGAHKTNGGAHRTGRILLCVYPFRWLFASLFTSFFGDANKPPSSPFSGEDILLQHTAVLLLHYRPVVPALLLLSYSQSSSPLRTPARKHRSNWRSLNVRQLDLAITANEYSTDYLQQTITVFTADDYTIYSRRLQQTISSVRRLASFAAPRFPPRKPKPKVG